MGPSKNFQADGDVASYVGTSFLGALLTGVTFGIGAPWAICMMQRWKAEHTIVNGRRLKFTGTGGELFGKWIVWMLLCIVTVGIYSFWIGPKLHVWTVENTDFSSDFVAPQPITSSQQVAAGM